MIATLFLCGDVMTGRGIDQILPHPSTPELFEPWVRSALTYVELAERASGPIPRPVPFEYVWGDALIELERVHPHARIVNLETSVTVSDAAWPGKGIHYRMHPANVPCLTAAGLDCCVLANNHVLDWGRGGLVETLNTLREAGIQTAGAGRDAGEAGAPAIVDIAPDARVLVFASCTESSGADCEWSATQECAGVNWIGSLSTQAADAIGRRVGRYARSRDIVVASIHWGGNWGYGISDAERAFAHRLIDVAGVDVVHGHSSHHVKGIEVYRDKPILYGCGDLLTDYEGISGHEEYRGDLALMYFVSLDAASGDLVRLIMTPTRTRHFRISRAPPVDASWLFATLDRECRPLGSGVSRQPDGTFALQWESH